MAAKGRRPFPSGCRSRTEWELTTKVEPYPQPVKYFEDMLTEGVREIAPADQSRSSSDQQYGAQALVGQLSAELAVAAAILIATAALGTTPPPRALQTGHSHTPGHHATGERHAQCSK